jgi:hypothetical protein
MKKKMAVLLAVLLLAAVGCGKNATNGDAPKSSGGQTQPGGTGSQPGNNGTQSGGSNNSGTKTNDKPAVEKVNLGPFQAGQGGKIGDIEIKVTQFAVKTKVAGLPPNYAYVLAKVSITNVGQADYAINLTEHFKWYNTEGKSFVMSTPGTNTEKQRLTGTVQVGKSTEGWIGYMLKLTPGTHKFVFQHPDWGTATWEYKA